MHQEHEQVVLTRPLPALGLEPGDDGVVVHARPGGAAYVVEFMSLDGQTIGVETLRHDELRGLRGVDEIHSRRE